MSLCHPGKGNVSCGTCCGLFNLKLDRDGYKRILRERTSLFRASVDFKTRHSIAAYRQTREVSEADLEKNDEMTYNCPYLGYVDESLSRIGCMIHPLFTGDPKSQNFSFYGASICQSYDCKNKENLASEMLAVFLRELSADSVEYSHLAGDSLFLYVIECWLRTKGFSLSEAIQEMKPLLADIFTSRLKANHKLYPTSFEIRYSNFLTENEVFDYFQDALGEKEKEALIAQMKNAPVRT